MNYEEQVDAALVIILKSAKSPSGKLLVEYPLWEKLDFEAKQEAFKRFYRMNNPRPEPLPDTLESVFEDGPEVAEALGY